MSVLGDTLHVAVVTSMQTVHDIVETMPVGFKPLKIPHDQGVVT